MLQTWASVMAAQGASGRNAEKEEYLEAIQTILVILHGLASGGMCCQACAVWRGGRIVQDRRDVTCEE